MFAEEFSQISDLTLVYSLSYLPVNPVKIKILQFVREAAKAGISEIPSKPQPVWTERIYAPCAKVCSQTISVLTVHRFKNFYRIGFEAI